MGFDIRRYDFRRSDLRRLNVNKLYDDDNKLISKFSKLSSKKHISPGTVNLFWNIF